MSRKADLSAWARRLQKCMKKRLHKRGEQSGSKLDIMLVRSSRASGRLPQVTARSWNAGSAALTRPKQTSSQHQGSRWAKTRGTAANLLTTDNWRDARSGPTVRGQARCFGRRPHLNGVPGYCTKSGRDRVAIHFPIANGRSCSSIAQGDGLMQRNPRLCCVLKVVTKVTD
jgi:hypothetical protein